MDKSIVLVPTIMPADTSNNMIYIPSELPLLRDMEVAKYDPSPHSPHPPTNPHSSNSPHPPTNPHSSNFPHPPHSMGQVEYSPLDILHPPSNVSPTSMVKEKVIERVVIKSGIQGEPGRPGERGKNGAVTNDFSQYILKIIDPSLITPEYRSASVPTFAGYSLIYLTNDNMYINDIELCNDSSINPTILNFRIIPIYGSQIDCIIINTTGCYPNVVPITSGSNINVVSFNLKNSLYGAYVDKGATFTITVRWR